MEPTDRELVQKFKNGERHAFDMLVSKYKRRLYSTVYRMTRNHQVTDEMLQETFLKLYTSIDKYDDSYPFYPWLNRIAVNTTINCLKREKKRRYDRSLENDREDFGYDPSDHKNPFDPEKAVITHEKDLKILESLQQISPTYRSALILKVFDGLSYKEIAETLHCSVGTVMSRMNRARKQLKNCLSDYLNKGVEQSK